MPGRLFSLLFCACLSLSVQAAEVIESFAATLQVQRDGLLLVSERIVVQAQGEQIRRGIYRELPDLYRLSPGLQRSTPIQWLGATRNGQPESTRAVRETYGERLYLGSADRLLEPGRHTYELRYRVDPQLLQSEQRDELYWNVTGNSWALPILETRVEVLLPEGARLGAAHAYTGFKGAQGRDYRIVARDDARLEVVSTETLDPGEGLTLAVDWQSGLVTRPAAWQRTWRLLVDNPQVPKGALAVLVLLGFYGLCWYRQGRDPRPGLMVPRYEPPEGLSPAMVSFLWHRGFAGGLDGVRELGVSLTDMAIRGLLRFEAEAGNLLLQRGSLASEAANFEERKLLDQLFAEEQPLPLGSKFQPRLQSARAALNTQLQRFAERYRSSNSDAWLIGVGIAAIATLILLFGSIEGAAVKEVAGLSLVALVLGGFGLLLLRDGTVAGGLVALLFALIALGGLATRVGDYTLLAIVLLWLQVLLFRFLLPASTAEGRQLLDELAGYREYLQLAEEDSLAQAGAAPPMNIAQYERHLPYAMALGVEEQWTARFVTALAAGLIEPQLREYRPGWSLGRDAEGINRELAPSLYRGVASACVETPVRQSSTSRSMPSAPSSSGGSASSGGGSSGGGSGGGGGGGW